MSDTASFDTRLAALTAKAAAALGRGPANVDWDRPVRLPVWLPGRLAASAITRFHAGERATAEMCGRLRRRPDMAPCRDFLALQALDEARHARLYGLYLDRLGGADPRPSGAGRVFARTAAWRGAPQAIVLAYHGILEGESLRLQQALDKWLPCPLFRDISAAIAKDEARHIAFGRLYLRAALPTLPRAERLDIYRWIRALWCEVVRDTITRFAPPGMVRVCGGLSGWMAGEWRERMDDMEALGLFTAEERPAFAASC